MKAKQFTLFVLGVALGLAAMLAGCRPSMPTVIPETPTPTTILPTATPEVSTPTPMPPSPTPEVPTPTAIPPTETPTPQPTETKPTNAAVVTANALNVRRGPGTLYSVITVVQRGTSLVVLGQDPSAGWLDVRLPDGTEGWVSRAFTDFVGAAPLVPTPPPPPTPTPTPTPIPTATPTATPTTTPTPTPTLTPTPTPTPTPVPEGWRGEYYDNVNLMGTPVSVRDDITIKFNWGSAAPAAGLPTDDFSIRWTRKLSVPAGIYQFSVRSDDGVRIWLDGALIIDEWHDFAGVTYTAEKTLAAGTHTIRIEYYEHRGLAEIQFWWERAGDFPQWRGAYFSNIELVGDPTLVRNDPTIDFNWGTAAPAAGLPADKFSTRWTRTLLFEESLYRFHVIVDDGARLFVDGYLVIDEWRDGGRREVTTDRTLAAGNHSLRVEYYERTGEALIRVWWEKITSYPDWKGEYWSNRKLEGSPTLVRNDKTIDFSWGTAAPAAGLPADNFSARWTRTVQFEAATYRFHVVVDDGARLYVDDVLAMDDWRDGGRREVTADRTLAAGNHSLRVEYYERTGEALIRVWWEKLTSYPDWKGEYWSNRKLEGSPALVRNDKAIDFNWGTVAPAAGFPADNFSARWTRTAQFDAATYRFHVVVDDGARLYVDDVLVIDEWRDGGRREVTADRTLAAGNNSLRVEYYERTGDALIRVWWERVTSPSYPDWKGEYWSNRKLEGSPALVRNDKAIDFNWGTGAPAAGLPADNFSARWTRAAQFEGATYRFHVVVDDGARLYVDDVLVIDEWRDGGRREVTTDRTLAAGNHSLRVEYYERTGDALIRVWWEKITSYPDWKGEYWSNGKLEGSPALVRNDKAIDFNWGTGAVAAGMPADKFSARWSRTVAFEPGIYHFKAQADDGIRVYVDGNLALDEWHDSGGGEVYTVDLPLSGEHKLVVEYYERTGQALVKFWWR